jgi:hypothetical protein
MSQIKTRIVFAVTDDNNPVLSTDLDLLKTFSIPGDPRYRYIHEIGIGTEINMEGKSYQVTDIMSHFFDVEYKNEGLLSKSYGERYPYNFEIIFKLKKNI